MMLRSRQQGEGRLGCVLILALGILFGFFSFKVVPVYIDGMNFDEDLAREASRAGANFWQDEKIQEDVRKMANFRGLKLESEVQIARSPSSPPELRLQVRYSRSVAFPGYTHVFQFNTRVSSLVGSF